MNSYPCCKHCPSVDHPGMNEHIEACFFWCDGVNAMSINSPEPLEDAEF